jgi:hypothetical protein
MSHFNWALVLDSMAAGNDAQALWIVGDGRVAPVVRHAFARSNQVASWLRARRAPRRPAAADARQLEVAL